MDENRFIRKDEAVFLDARGAFLPSLRFFVSGERSHSLERGFPSFPNVRRKH